MATPGALNAFAATGENPINYIVRHMNLDPGVLAAANQLANRQAVRESTRVFSAYELPDGTRIWIITEADRSSPKGHTIRPTICRLRKGETIGGHGH